MVGGRRGGARKDVEDECRGRKQRSDESLPGKKDQGPPDDQGRVADLEKLAEETAWKRFAEEVPAGRNSWTSRQVTRIGHDPGS